MDKCQRSFTDQLHKCVDPQMKIFDAFEKVFKGIADVQTNFNKRLEALEAKFQNPTSAPLCTPQNVPLSTTSNAEKELSEIISKVDNMQIEINKNNLIYYGAPESESETGSELFSKIAPLLPSRDPVPVTILVTRIGRKKDQDPKLPNRPRPVKVNFPNLVSRQAAKRPLLSQGLPTFSQ